MIALIQRVIRAEVEVANERVGCIRRGLLAFIGVVRDDREPDAIRLLERILTYRVFPDETGRMNHALTDIGGGLLLVPQFTLAADTQKGTRPSFTPAAAPEVGRRLFDHLLTLARERHPDVASGIYGADMQVHLINDGPVTFWLQTA